MNILALGDLVGTEILPHLKKNLPAIKAEHSIDFITANGENTTEIKGLSYPDAKRVFDSGVDFITGGNHIFGKRDLYPLLDSSSSIIRPANYPGCVPGRGYSIVNVNSRRLLCINICGCVYMESLACPFKTVDDILKSESGKYDFAMMDIHAEATSEKYALARYFDGRIALMYGTHTHVTTADEQLLPGGSAYITDLGMCGPINGILGTDSNAVITRFRTHMPTRFSTAKAPVSAHGVIFSVDELTLKPVSIKRISF